jgi:nitroreductase
MNPHLAPWAIDSEAFPTNGYASDQLDFLLNYAILAPSSHNTQPWLFRINAMDVELFADRRRALPVVDPQDRELTISCGAALFHLRVAAEYFGHRYRVELLPDPANRDLLARFHLGLSGETSSDDILLFHSLTKRHTNRQAFLADPVHQTVLDLLMESAKEESAWLRLVEGDEERGWLADLVAAADRKQWSDHAFREELARWLRTHPDRASDGLVVQSMGVKDWMAFMAPLLVRTFDRGGGEAAKDREIALHSPVLAVLGTEKDDVRSWLAAGQALASVLLHARSEDVWVSFLNQPIEVEETRQQLAAGLGLAGHPQLLLRLGYGPSASPTPRRPVREVLIRQDGHHRSLPLEHSAPD